MFLIRPRISSTRQTVIRGPTLTGFGKRPDLTPCHHEDLPIGIIGGIGGVDFLLHRKNIF